MKSLFWRAAILFPLLWRTVLPAQVCLPGDESPGPYICWPYITNISGTNYGFTPDFPPSGFCGTIENNAWISFSPCQSRVVFSIISTDCRNNLGLEAAIFDQSRNLVSNCYSSNGVNLGGSVTAEYLIPGEIYYFMIDGYEGDECNYIVTATEGVNPPGTPVVSSQTGYINGSYEVCEGAIVNYTAVPAVCNLTGNGMMCPLPDLSEYYDTAFYWTVPPGATIIEDRGSEIQVRWDNVQPGRISVIMDVSSLNGSCPECAGGIPAFACSNEILPLSISRRTPYVNVLPAINLCSGECFEIGGEAFCETGHYELSFIAADGCDSTVIFDVLVFPTKENQLPEQYICEGDCLTIAGQSFCDAGEYEIRLNTTAGCDSLIVFEIIELETKMTQLPPISICEGDCFEMEGQSFCENGSYRLDLNTAAGCDSIVEFSIVVLKMSENILPAVEICEGDCYEFEGQEYCESGTFKFYKTNQAGCDSVIVLNVIKNPSEETVLPDINLCEGDYFEIGGEKFNEEGKNQIGFKNRFGCDSTVVFDIKHRLLDVILPESVIVSPDNPTILIQPELIGDSANLKFEWEGFSEPYNSLTSEVGIPGMYTLTITDTLIGCSVTRSMEVYQLQRGCQTGLFISPSSNCQTAPFLCGEFLDGFCASTDSFKQFSVRGNLQEVVSDSIENPKWIRWSPCSETATFRLGVKKSNEQKGVAVSVLATDDCELYNAVLNSTEVAPASVRTFSIDGLMPGEIYRFLIDGIDADICEFQIEIIEGVSKEPLEWEMVSPPQIVGADKFCPGIPQILSVVPPVCRVKNGDCAFAGELMIVHPTEIAWNLPSAARWIEMGRDSIEIVFEENALKGKTQDYLPDGRILTDMISAEISTTLKLLDAVICTNEDTCKFLTDFRIEVNHELEVLPTIDVCESTNYEFCGEVLTESKLKVCRDGCKTTVQKVNVHESQKIDHGFVRICPGTCFSMPVTGQEICDEGVYTFPIKSKCGGTETVVIGFYDKETIVAGAVTEICHPLHTSYRVSFDLSEGVPPYRVDGEIVPRGRFLSADSIPNGEPYIFEITDASVCKSKIYVQGRYECSPLCNSSAGTMSSQILNICENTVARPTHYQNITLDSDDGLEFILHTSPSDVPGTILARSPEGDFTYLEDLMEYDRVYYASAIVGTMVGGEVDLNDPCLSVAPGQPVIFKKTPSVTLEDAVVLDCKNTGVTLSPGNLAVDDNFTWVLPNGSTVSGENIFVDTPGEYVFQAIGANNCSLIKTVLISENKIFPIADAGDDKILHCEQEFAMLDASGSSEGRKIVYEWVTDTGEIEGNNTLSSVKVTKPGGYFLKVKNRESGCEKIDSVLVIREDEPQHSVKLEIELPTCFGMNDGVINIKNISGGVPPYAMSFDGDNFSDFESFRYLQSGSYELLVKDALGCVLREEVIVGEPEEVAVDLGDDQFITLGDKVELTVASTIEPAKIEWWSSLGDSFEKEPVWEIVPPESSTWFVRVYDERGCFAEDELNILVKDATVYIPSGFSPNGDKKNDFFTVFAGESVLRVRSLRIYNRRGGLVFENSNFPANTEAEGWNGNVKGKEIRPDVFVYAADVEFINGDIKTFRGDVTLIR